MRKLDLSEMYVDQRTINVVTEVLKSKRYVDGENLRRFEEEFASFCSSEYAVGVSSGTAAILLSLLSLDISKGDEIIVPSHTFIATASPMLFLGAKPVFVDIDRETYTIDPNLIEEQITEKTKAIIPVHIYGHSCDMDPILEIAEKHGLYVIEDACQAHGGEYKRKKVGSLGDLACFSFYPSKNMTVCGDGGMVVTHDEKLAEKIGMLRDHGRKEKYIHELRGLNFRLSEIHSAIGREQLKKLPEWIRKRRIIAEIYGNLLRDIPGIELPVEKEWAKHVYHLYVIMTQNREQLSEYLKENQIATGIHYPVPVHRQPIMQEFVSKVKLPVTGAYVEDILSLPMHPHIKEIEVRHIAEKIRDFVK